MHFLPFYRGCNLFEMFSWNMVLFKVWILISPDGCGHFIGDLKKAQEFLNIYFCLQWHLGIFCVSLFVCHFFYEDYDDSNFIV